MPVDKKSIPHARLSAESRKRLNEREAEVHAKKFKSDVDSDSEYVEAPETPELPASAVDLTELDEEECDISVRDLRNRATVVSKTERIHMNRLTEMLKNPLLDSQERKKLTAYKKLCIGNNEFKVEYTHGGAAVLESGRLYARNMVGLQGLSKSTRNYLTEGLYQDVDMKNSQPNIFLQLMKNAKNDCPELETYVADRSEALRKTGASKKTVLTYLNTSEITIQNTFFKRIHSAIYNELFPTLRVKPEWQDLWTSIEKSKAAKFKNNRGGSFMSHVYQTTENRVLPKMTSSLEAVGFAVDTLIFDGVLVRRKSGLHLSSQVLRKVEKEVLSSTGYEICLVEKPMPIGREFALSAKVATPVQNLQPVSTTVDSNDQFSRDKALQIYDNGNNTSGFVSYMNNYFAKVTEEEDVWYCNRRTTGEALLMRGKRQMWEAYSHICYRGGKQSMPLLEIWAAEEEMRTFRKIVFDPSHAGDNGTEALNLFQGFQAKLVESVDLELIRPLINHVERVLAVGKADEAEYIFNWMASILTNPSEKNGTALVFHGKQGTGKNIFFEFFGKMIIGPHHYTYIQNINDLTGQFTSFHARAIFVLADEVTFAGGHKGNNMLKTAITAELAKWETKGKAAVQVPNYMNLAGFLNQDDCFRIEESCRRYYVQKPSEEVIGDFEYFQPLVDLKNNQTAADHFYTYLMQRDLSQFNVRMIPNTEAKENMKQYSKSAVQLFADELLAGEVECPRVFNIIREDNEDEGMISGRITCRKKHTR